MDLEGARAHFGPWFLAPGSFCMPKRPKRRYQSIVRAVYGTPWAIKPEKLEAIRSFLARRSAGDVLTREEVRAALSGRPQPVQTEAKKVALINVMGTVAQRLSLMDEISGGVSTEALGRAFDKAVADGNVSTIVLNIDSPGGSVFGVQELAEKIFAARDKKRIIAIANSEAASAAYWIASAAGELVATPGGWVGSIGVLMLHTSSARYEEKEGFDTTITRQPAEKAEGAAGEALTEEAKAHRQETVDQVYATFVAAVAKHRGVSEAEVKGGFGAGRMVLAAEALEAGMVDRLATLEQVLSELGVSAKAQPDTTSEPAFPLEGLKMNAKIFGALVRIGMCPITATVEAAGAALARFFAAQGKDVPPKEEDQLAALEAYVATLTASGGTHQVQQLATAIAPLAGGDERAADITSAVQMQIGIPEARKLELIRELITAKDSAGKPITYQQAIHRLQKEAADAAQANTPGATVVTPGAAERDKFLTAARDALLVRTFKGERPKQIFSQRTREYTDWKPAAGGPRSLLSLAQHCLIQCGATSGRVLNLAPSEIAKLVMGGQASQLGLEGLFASSDGPAYNVSGMFSNILFDAANVSLRRSFDDARSTYEVWAAQGEDIPDFKDVHRVIAGEFGDPRAIPEDGEFEETTLTDGKEKYRLTTWGEVFSHSWQLIVNDRLGSFMEAPTKMGNAMKRKSNRLVYQPLKDNTALLNDNVALFHASAVPTGHNNITTGVLTTVADYVSAWNTMSKKMREQKGLNTTDGGTLNIPPFFVLFPPSLRGIIRQTLGSSSSDATNAGVTNIWEQGLTPVEESELGAAATGGSDVMHYLAADTNDVDTVEYAHLEGMPAPVIEQETAFDRLAIRRRIYWAFGVKPLDYRGLQRHNGA